MLQKCDSMTLCVLINWFLSLTNLYNYGCDTVNILFDSLSAALAMYSYSPYSCALCGGGHY